MPRTLRKALRGCTVSQGTVITDHSGGDHAADTETTTSKSRERGLSGVTLYQSSQLDPRSDNLVSGTEQLTTLAGRGCHIKRT